MVAVYVVLAANGLEAENVTAVPSGVTTPGIAVVPCLSVKVTWSSVAGFMASLKVAATVPLTGAFAAPLAGTVEMTVGAVVSAVASVVKVQLWGVASGVPARSLAATVMVAV